KQLDEHIVNEKGLHGQELLKKKTVALICELYECVNCARFFKFWSENQEPNTLEIIECQFCDEGSIHNGKIETETCIECGGEFITERKNPLLEEYADTIHFALSIANDLGYTEHKYIHTEGTDLNDLVLGITSVATIIPQSRSKRHISTLINNVIQLGYQLGSDEEQVIDAYDVKNKGNHERQMTNYRSEERRVGKDVR